MFGGRGLLSVFTKANLGGMGLFCRNQGTATPRYAFCTLRDTGPFFWAWLSPCLGAGLLGSTV